MRTIVPALMVLGVLIGAAPASAACGWIGTRIECDLGETRLAIGTQTVEEPSHAGSIRPQPFRGGGGFPRHDVPAHAFELDLQDVGADPRLCREIGNETYCY